VLLSRINIANRVIASPDGTVGRSNLLLPKILFRSLGKFFRIQHYLLLNLSYFLGAYLAGQARRLAVRGAGSLRILARGANSISFARKNPNPYKPIMPKIAVSGARFLPPPKNLAPQAS